MIYKCIQYFREIQAAFDRLNGNDTDNNDDKYYVDEYNATPAVITRLTRSAQAGDRRIKVANQVHCQIGMIVQLSNSAGQSETRTIVGFGSLVLHSNLSYSYPVGSIVMIYAAHSGVGEIVGKRVIYNILRFKKAGNCRFL